MKRKSLLIMLLMALFAPLAMNAQTLTVHDGTGTNRYVPFYGYYADKDQQNQMIYPADELSVMSGMSITGMSFYYSSVGYGSSVGNWTISLGETDATTLSGLDATTALTVVFSGDLESLFNTSDQTLNITFDADYAYRGGNLLVEFSHSAGSYRDYYFYGETVTGASYCYSAQRNFLPKTTFNYEVPSNCAKPTGLTFALTQGNGTVASLSWTENGDATAWQICLNGNEDNLIDVTTNPYQLTGLTPETEYTAKVRANCGSEQSSWSNEVSFTPTNAYNLTVNDGTQTNGYVPIYGYYCDSYTKSQFIIPAESLADMVYGNITKMTFYASQASVDWGNATFEVYMTETDETTLSALADYSTMEKVMNAGSLSISGNQMVVTLDAPYQYMGGNLMIGFLQTVEGTYKTSTWYGITATGASMGGYESSKAVSQQNFLPKTTFEYTPGEAPTCLKPTGFAYSNVTGRTADLSWTANGEETAWQISYSAREGDAEDGEIIDVTENPYTLERLEPETTYYVYVRANCGSEDGTSDWSSKISFTTLEACPAPTNVTVSDLEPFAATVSWEGTAESYSLRYRVFNGFTYDFESAEAWVVDDFSPCTTYDGDGSATYGIQDVTFTNSSYTGSVIAMESGYIGTNWTAHNGNIFGCFMDATSGENNDYFILPEMEIGRGYFFKFWAKSITASYGLERIKVGIYGRDGLESYLEGSASAYAEVPTEWTEYSYDLSDYVGQTIKLAINCVSADAFALLIDDFYVGNPNNTDWDETLTDVASPYTFERLTDGTTYEVEVQAVCGGEDGNSAWTATTMFTTPSNCAAPTSLATNDIMPESATLSWEGFNDEYNIQYRTGESRDEIYYDSFESGVSSWTATSGGSVYSGVPHTGTYFWAFTGTGSIIAPAIGTDLERGSTVEFYYYPYGGNGSATVSIGYSSTTSDDDAFTWGRETTLSVSGYTLYSEEVPTGTLYIGIKVSAIDCSYLLIDDFGVYGPMTEAGRWETVEGVTSPYELPNLAIDTYYEWQVQGVNRDCDGGATEWSTSAFFTTNDGLMFVNEGNWNEDGNWYLREVPAAGSSVVIAANCTIPAGYIAEAEEVTVNDDVTLTIKDGGQLIHFNEGVWAIMEKEITGYSAEKDNYYLIASPVTQRVYNDVNYVFPEYIDGLLENDYDLYQFDGTADREWLNYEAGSFDYMFPGIGYLYANSEDDTLYFEGELHPFDPDYANNYGLLNYTASDEAFNGFNLVGNLFAADGYIVIADYDSEEGVTGISEDVYFYTMGDGELVPGTGAVAPMQGVFVQASSDSQAALCYTEQLRSNNALNMTLSQNGKRVDAAYIRFNEGSELSKIQLNPNHTKLFFTKDNQDYAVVRSENQGEMPVSFKAENNGTYTMSFSNENVEFSYLHLIDNLTGNDVDLLETPSYSFDAKTTDYAQRFRLVFATGNASDDNFAYYSDGTLVINNEGNATMNVYDVTGRLVNTQSVNGSCQVKLNTTAGVYMIQLVNGDNTKSQKIVVK